MKSLTVKIFPILVFASLIFWFACKEDTTPQGPDCTLPGASLSYTLNIKRIVDTQCLSCHSGAGPGVGDFSTFEGMKSALETGKVLDRVVIKKEMPQGGGMSQSQRDSINCWIIDGFPK